MILCDLPYGVTAKNKWDNIIPFEELWAQYNRVIKANGAIVLFGQDKFTAKCMMSNPKMHRYNLIWNKVLPSGFLNANRMPLRSHEDIMVFYKKLPTYNPQKRKGTPCHKKGKSVGAMNDGVFRNDNYGDEVNRMKYTYTYLFDEAHGIDLMSQENSHHRLTLGAHCRAAEDFIKQKYPDDKRLQLAALFHDNGKVFTKTRFNTRGEEDGQCHYYQHHCVGAYDFLLYADAMGVSDRDAIYISNLIYFHMHPFMSWDKSEKSRRKAVKAIGQEMYDDIMKLHAADLAAH